MFHPLFDAADPTFRVLASDHKAPAVEALCTSPWVAMSAMQKAIRRGDVELAERAAVTLLKCDPSRLWRRLAGIVIEDIGLASVETIRLVMAATSGKAFRQQFGGDHRVASILVARMCAAPKCRAADDMLITISHHHELEALRGDLARKTVAEHLSRVKSRSALLGASLAALHASGTRWTGQIAGQTPDPMALFAAMKSAGVEREVVDLAEQGFRRTREALPVLLPLLSCARPFGELPVADDNFPKVVIGRSGIPTFCFDAFSYEGKSALAHFLKRDTATGRWLHKRVPAKKHMSVLAGGLFRVEGGLVRQRIAWPAAATLRAMADAGYHGLKLTDPATLLDLIRADLPKLDEVRTLSSVQVGHAE